LHGIIHCTGGGQTKVLHFVDNLHIIKDTLFELPLLFKEIQLQSNIPWREMYQVFNMGHRMELFVKKEIAKSIIAISESLGVEAKVIGHVEVWEGKKLTIKSQHDNSILTY